MMVLYIFFFLFHDYLPWWWWGARMRGWLVHHPVILFGEIMWNLMLSFRSPPHAQCCSQMHLGAKNRILNAPLMERHRVATWSSSDRTAEFPRTIFHQIPFFPVSFPSLFSPWILWQKKETGHWYEGTLLTKLKARLMPNHQRSELFAEIPRVLRF